MSGEYDIAGTVGLYERDSDEERLKIPGPIKEDISLYVKSSSTFLSNFLMKFSVDHCSW